MSHSIRPQIALKRAKSSPEGAHGGGGVLQGYPG